MTAKQDFEALLLKYESVGMLPKGKTADLMESYDMITAPPAEVVPEVDHDALDERTKARARKA
jgi:hypothetical protein